MHSPTIAIGGPGFCLKIWEMSTSGSSCRVTCYLLWFGSSKSPPSWGVCWTVPESPQDFQMQFRLSIRWREPLGGQCWNHRLSHWHFCFSSFVPVGSSLSQLPCCVCHSSCIFVRFWWWSFLSSWWHWSFSLFSFLLTLECPEFQKSPSWWFVQPSRWDYVDRILVSANCRRGSWTPLGMIGRGCCPQCRLDWRGIHGYHQLVPRKLWGRSSPQIRRSFR